ncbi:unnamed protein product (macronuclear) [Paramecium tetraurelia]|uniref:Uncharacterized protein n=1 Tax=Paramecium tetraurelia TaxID=5888 RepID=A0BBV8_PARTE|nr:uncharacterized protein GSPATT00000460001 [Paramecium tetraurelia]CAK56025.1 unnamed protein product [Paramecium tetraurelia]|eukprot:XP_001423423.1 hypothetical protein (macronuclear) [Paramecium tetraurelia strain d4-2]
MIVNQIYQPVEFIYSYTIGGKEQQHLQLKNQLPQKKRNLTEEDRRKIKNEIQNEFNKKKTLKKKIQKQIIIKVNHKKYLKLFIKLKSRKNKVKKLLLGKKIKIIKRERIFQLAQDDVDQQVKVKDAYDKEYDKEEERKINFRF